MPPKEYEPGALKFSAHSHVPSIMPTEYVAGETVTGPATRCELHATTAVRKTRYLINFISFG